MAQRHENWLIIIMTEVSAVAGLWVAVAQHVERWRLAVVGCVVPHEPHLQLGVGPPLHT